MEMNNVSKVFPARVRRSVDVTNTKGSFAWSLKPLFIWMKLISIDLGYYDDNQKSLKFSDGLKSKLFTFFSIFLFLINVVSQIMTFQFLQIEKKNIFIEISSTTFVNRVIQAINIGFDCVGTHLCLLMLVQFHWKKFWKSIQKLEYIIQDKSVYDRSRILTIVGLFSMLITVTPKQLQYVL